MNYRIVTLAALLLAFLASAPRAAAAAGSDNSPYGANFFPNVTLVTQDGKKVNFYDDLLKDKKVMIDFIYATCTQSCPLQTAKLAQVQKALGSRIGKDIFIYSITLDPNHDTPEVLKAYAERFGAKWQFLTGKKEDVDLVRFKLGERTAKEGHGNSVRLGNVAAGQWMRLPLDADVNYLVTEIGKTLIPNWYATQQVKGFEEAPRLEIKAGQRDQLMGQGLFRGRCASCHTIGAGDRIGPDLKDVTVRRDRSWIARYIIGPDRVLASKDPIAVDLAKRYKVPMPALDLTHEQVDYLVAYLEMQTSHPAATTASAQAPAHKH